MTDRQGIGYGVILLTFLVAFVLAVLPLPFWLQWGRPEWVVLTLIYWCIALPQRVGIATGLVMGVGMDVLEGAILGQNACSYLIRKYKFALPFKTEAILIRPKLY